MKGALGVLPACCLTASGQNYYYNSYIHYICFCILHTFLDVSKLLSQVNKSLKGLATLANIFVHLTTYVAHHTYATILKQSRFDRVGLVKRWVMVLTITPCLAADVMSVLLFSSYTVLSGTE
jgi:hypothetical protein